MKKMFALILICGAALGIQSFTTAGVPEFGQCGGIGWTGPTTCESGYTCTVVNDYYSQCLTGDGGGDNTKKYWKAVGVSCTYYCWYMDNAGKYYSIAKAGTATSCQQVTYESSCTSLACAPVVPC